jgi:hypothetical protein
VTFIFLFSFCSSFNFFSSHLCFLMIFFEVWAIAKKKGIGEYKRRKGESKPWKILCNDNSITKILRKRGKGEKGWMEEKKKKWRKKKG